MATPPEQSSERPELVQQRSEGMLGRLRGRLGEAGLVRPRRGRLVAGVLSGIARRFDLSPWAVRAAFIVSILLPGPQFLLYVALWIVMPTES